MCSRISHNVLEQVLKDSMKTRSSYLPKRQTLRLLLTLPRESIHSPHQLLVWSGTGMAIEALQIGGELALNVKVLKAILHLCSLELEGICHQEEMSRLG